MGQASNDHFSSPELAREKAREALAPQAQVPLEAIKPNRIKSYGKIILPAIALGLGLTAFSWPLLTDTDVSFTLSKDQVTESDGRVLMNNLRYTGVDKKDRLFVVNAAQGEQEDPAAKRVRLSMIDATVDLEDDGALFLKANSGLYRIEEEELELTGDVELKSNEGLSISMAGAEVKLADKTAVGEGNVKGQSPLGSLTSDVMRINLSDSTGVFEGRVRLKITPKRTLQQQPATNAR